MNGAISLGEARVRRAAHEAMLASCPDYRDQVRREMAGYAQCECCERWHRAGNGCPACEASSPIVTLAAVIGLAMTLA